MRQILSQFGKMRTSQVYILLAIVCIFWISFGWVEADSSPGITKGIETNALINVSDIICSGDTQCDSVLAPLSSSGTGDANDPYIIEGYHVQSGSIEILHTTKHITLRGNSILSAGIGINLSNTSGQIIIENTNISTSAQYGIQARYIHSSLIIRGNLFEDTQTWAIWVGDNNVGQSVPVNTIEVYNNTFLGVERGIIAYQVDSAHVYNNTFSQIFSFPLDMGYINDSIVNDNTIFNSGYGMRFNQHKQLLVANNTIQEISNPSAAGIWEYMFNEDHLYNRTYLNNTIHNIANNGINLAGYASVINNTISGIGYGGVLSLVNTTIDGNFITDYSNYGLYSAIDAGVNSTIMSNAITHGPGTAIVLASDSIASKNVIDNVTGYGIDARNSIDTVISENVISRTAFDSIIVYNGAKVINNQITYALQNAISVEGVSGGLVDNNHISHSGGSGIYLSLTTDTIVSANSITNSTLFSIYSRSSPTSKFNDNILTDSIGLDSVNVENGAAYMGYTFSGNTINGDPFGFFEGHSSNITGTYGQIYIYDSHDLSLNGVTISTLNRPLTILFSNRIVIDSITLSGKEGYAIRNLGTQSSLTIIDSIFSNNKGVSIISEGNFEIRNSIVQNGDTDGIHAYGHGTVFGNTISGNDGVGLRIFGSSYIVNDNTFDSNTGYAILIEAGGSYSQIHHNNFLSNNVGGNTQAFDNGTSNTWFETETQEGNHWTDYSGSGSYSIGGPNFVADQYPLDFIVFPRVTETTPSSHTSSDGSPTPSSSFTPSDSEGGFLYFPISLFFTSTICLYFVRRKKL